MFSKPYRRNTIRVDDLISMLDSESITGNVSTPQQSVVTQSSAIASISENDEVIVGQIIESGGIVDQKPEIDPNSVDEIRINKSINTVQVKEVEIPEEPENPQENIRGPIRVKRIKVDESAAVKWLL